MITTTSPSISTPSITIRYAILACVKAKCFIKEIESIINQDEKLLKATSLK